MNEKQYAVWKSSLLPKIVLKTPSTIINQEHKRLNLKITEFNQLHPMHRPMSRETHI